MPKAPERDISLDRFRGALIAIMVLAHMRGLALAGITAAHGFSSIPEYFYLICGLVAGRAWPETLARDGARGVLRKAGRRALQVYVLHLGPLWLVALATLLVPGYAAIAEPALGDFRAHPERFLTAALLLYQPGYFDILPIFILFAFLGPWVSLARARHGALAPLAVSVAVWGMAQAGLSVPALDAWIDRPEIALGDFNPFALQLVFVVGVLLGEESRRRMLPLPPRLLAGAFVLWLAETALAHAWIVIPGFDANAMRHPRDNLHPMRILDLAAFSVLMWGLVRHAPRLFSLNTPLHAWLGLLGREGMVVFALHLGFTYWIGMRIWDLVAASGAESVLGPRGVVVAALGIEFGALLALIGAAWGLEAAGRSRRLRKPQGAMAPA